MSDDARKKLRSLMLHIRKEALRHELKSASHQVKARVIHEEASRNGHDKAAADCRVAADRWKDWGDALEELLEKER